MSGCGVAPDPTLGAGISDPALSGTIPADPPSAGAVVVEPGIDVELGAGQGIAGAPGVKGDPGPAGPVVQAQTFQILGASSFTAAHGLAYVPSVRVTDATGAEVETDIFHSPGQLTAVFPGPFLGTLTIG